MRTGWKRGRRGGQSRQRLESVPWVWRVVSRPSDPSSIVLSCLPGTRSSASAGNWFWLGLNSVVDHRHITREA